MGCNISTESEYEICCVCYLEIIENGIKKCCHCKEYVHSVDCINFFVCDEKIVCLNCCPEDKISALNKYENWGGQGVPSPHKNHIKVNNNKNMNIISPTRTDAAGKTTL